MICGWEGNHRPGVAVAKRHRLQWFIHLQAHGLRKGDEPTLLMGYGIFTIVCMAQTGTTPTLRHL